jgi:hypothetical protein
MTVFAHVFSLDKVYKIWDILIALDVKYMPIFIAYSILFLMRDVILSQDFSQVRSLICVLVKHHLNSSLEYADIYTTTYC